MDPNTARIRALNDELRHDLSLGHAVMTPGVAALGPEAVARIVKTIEVYDNFCHANDPYEEHDFGSFEAELLRIFTTSARSSLKRKSASSKINVPLNASSVWKIGETVEAPLAKNPL